MLQRALFIANPFQIPLDYQLDKAILHHLGNYPFDGKDGR